MAAHRDAMVAAFVERQLNAVMQTMAEEFDSMCKFFWNYKPEEEHTHAMYNEYLRFTALLEPLLVKSLSSWGTDVHHIARELEVVADQDEAVRAIFDNLVSYLDFHKFAAMLYNRFWDLHPIKHVRVFWDIENVSPQVPQHGVALIEALYHFLEDLGCHGAGVDSAFFAFPTLVDLNQMRERTRNILLDSRIFLVLCKNKGEAADHQIKSLVAQERARVEMSDLDPRGTAFVLISSDRDFIATARELRQTGYLVFVIHDAKDEANKHMLSLHATRAFPWSSVVRMLRDGDQSGDQQPPANLAPTGGPSSSQAPSSHQQPPTATTSQMSILTSWCHHHVRPGLNVVSQFQRQRNLWVCMLEVQHGPTMAVSTAKYTKQAAKDEAAGMAVRRLAESGLWTAGQHERARVVRVFQVPPVFQVPLLMR